MCSQEPDKVARLTVTRLLDDWIVEGMFQIGYILSRRGDLVWFIGLPFCAVLFALGSQLWLPAVALSSVALWVTFPHHFATWVRTYGFSEDRKRWTDRLIIGPLIIFGFTFLGAMVVSPHVVPGQYPLGSSAQHYAAAWFWPDL